MDSPMRAAAETRTDGELLDAARNDDEAALAVLFERHRDRLERMVRLRIDRRLQSRVDPADVVQETYLAVRGKFPQYAAKAHLPFFLWLRLEVSQRLVDVHRFHLGTRMRDAGQEVSLHRGPLPPVSSASLAEHLLGKLTTASHAAIRVELRLRVQEALNSMDPFDREVLVLRHFEELSNSETARVLDIKPTAAVNRYVRALKRLRHVFEGMPGGIEGVWG
ncbi:MAG TPA: sigma-70 family RNA polymerase sigma factor [Urbifossiella sp.]|jgi:RNA polymerase sigma-70 factor (ECF subfamily)|nr:sigma-70 family RNA polymerase sigma factor [Urbifossiella sp.]